MCTSGASIERGTARWPLCNGRPDTAIRILGMPSPLCARCTGILLGCAGGALTLHAVTVPTVPLAIAILACLPALIDGLRSYYGGGTTNLRRLSTGVLLGSAIVLYLQ